MHAHDLYRVLYLRGFQRLNYVRAYYKCNINTQVYYNVRGRATPCMYMLLICIYCNGRDFDQYTFLHEHTHLHVVYALNGFLNKLYKMSSYKYIHLLHPTAINSFCVRNGRARKHRDRQRDRDT